PREEIRLKSPFAADAGHAWVAALPEDLAAEADDSVNKYRSPWRLLEDGKAIGAPHALHDDIRAIGRGRHSHWKTQLLFSTRDGSDPNANGRAYVIVHDAPPRKPSLPSSTEERPQAASRSTDDPTASKLADILKRRGVREVAYFH